VPESANPYDEVLYPGRAYPEAHPDRLATCARLLGLQPAPVATCRVLELGCGNAAHLLSLATALPNAEFVGMDGSERAIAAGTELARAAQLERVTLIQADLATFAFDGPKFDYVIAHGVYSWIPPGAQDALLSACRRHLADNGVAYVSYNTYPGAHARELVREMMLFHAGQIEDPMEKVRRGIEFVRFVRSVQPDGTSLAAILDAELRRLSIGSSEYVFHDDFSEYNVPVYFAGLVTHAAAHGLKFLSEADFSFVEDPRLPAAVRAQISQFASGDPVAEQQYLDFATGTPFRRTLLVPEAAPVSREIPAARVLGLYLAARVRLGAPNPELGSRAPATFGEKETGQIVVEEPLAKAALLVLAEVWPHAIETGVLIVRALALCDNARPSDAERKQALDLLAGFLLRLAAHKQLEFHTTPPCFAARPGERPTATPLARAQILSSPNVTSLRQQAIRLEDEPSRILLELLDGTRNRTELLQLLHQRLAERATEEPTPELSLARLEGLLLRMAESGLLVA
jgi:SAM-dependent methyltransferase